MPGTVGFRTTAGLRQPLLVARRVFRAECDICDAQTHVHRRAAGVSPPWYRKPHLQRRPTFPNPARSPRHDRIPSHGWLTPAALGCATFSGSIAGLAPPVTKLLEPFFHPNRIKTTTLYPTGRGAARTCSEKQSRYERAKKRGEFAGLLERIRRSNPTYEVHGSG